MLPGNRIKCKCGGKLFRMQQLGTAHHELYCNKCKKKIMTLKQTPEEFKKSMEGFDSL